MESVVSRLEAVASRLEAVEGRLKPTSSQPSAVGFTPPKFGVPLPGLATPVRKASAATPVEAETGKSSSGAELLKAWDAEVTPALESFSKAAQAVGQEVLPVSQIVEKAFKAERSVVDAMGQCQKPDNAGLQKLIAPVGAQMQAATELSEGRRSSAFNHLKAVAEALQALSWVVYSGPNSGMSPPAQHVQEAWQSAEFWANKILMEFRNKDVNQVSWVKALNSLLIALKGHVEKHHRAGPTWNAQGIPVTSFVPSTGGTATKPSGGVPPKPAGGAPPPPPPPAAGSLNKPKAAATGGRANPGAGLSAVFSEINNKGDGVTSGLRKVTDDMKTKNRTDRTGVVSGAIPASAQPPSSVAASAKAKPSAPARLECEQGRKWIVENYSGAHDLVIDDTTPKQTVYIYRCRNSTIQVKGKVNALTIDECSKVGVVFENLVASCEVVNSTGVQVQVTGVVHTIIVDKCDGIQLYLSEGSLASSITTAKSSAVNVLVPGRPGEDMTELYVPEQFITTIEKGKLVTVPVSHSGG